MAAAKRIGTWIQALVAKSRKVPCGILRENNFADIDSLAFAALGSS
jgi:hypothetical protein